MAMFNSKLYDLKPFSSAGSNIIQHPTAGPRKVFGGSISTQKCPFWGWFYMYPTHTHTHTRILCVYMYIYLCVCMCFFFLVCVYIYIYTYVYIVYIHTHTHTHIYIYYIYLFKCKIQFHISNSWFKDIKNNIFDSLLVPLPPVEALSRSVLDLGMSWRLLHPTAWRYIGHGDIYTCTYPLVN